MGLSDDFKCPVCVADFSCESPEQFALHVADCTNRCAAPANCGDIKTACPKCHFVYTISNSAVDILFHEEECVRLNQTFKSSKDLNKRGKRIRDKTKQEPEQDSIVSNTNHKPCVHPSLCGVCGQGGRTLLQCQDGCARAFHAACLGLSNIREKTQEPWTCPECTRGLHSCGICGFLGNDTVDMIMCSIPECGYFYHEMCLRKERGKEFKGPLVCSRHQCNKCNMIENNMSNCSSCVFCTNMYHKTCTKPMENEFEIPDFFVCIAHEKPQPSVTQRCALKGKVQVGDVVLILEYKNNLLPLSAKCVTDSNQWGVVTAMEDFDLETRLLTLKNFADGTFISVPSRYVLPVTTVSAYPSLEAMLGEVVAWHVQNELSIRDVKSHDEAFHDKILAESISAFEAKAKELRIDSSTLMKYAQNGYDTYMENLSMMQFGATSTPIFAFLDTRKRDLTTKPLKSLKNGGSSSFKHSGNIIQEPDFLIGVLSDFDNDIHLQAEVCKASEVHAVTAPTVQGEQEISVCLRRSSSSEAVTKEPALLEAKPKSPSTDMSPQIIAVSASTDVTLDTNGLLETKEESTSLEKSIRKKKVEKEVLLSKSIDTPYETIEKEIINSETKLPDKRLEKKLMIPIKTNHQPESKAAITTSVKHSEQKVIASVLLEQSAKPKAFVELNSPVVLQQKTDTPSSVILGSSNVQPQENTISELDHEQRKTLDSTTPQKVSLSLDSSSEKVKTDQGSHLSESPEKQKGFVQSDEKRQEKRQMTETVDPSPLKKIKVDDEKAIDIVMDEENPSVLPPKKKFELKRSLKRKKIVTAIPSGVIKELEKEVFHFLEKGRLRSQLVKGLNTKLVTPVPFFRPGMTVHHLSGRRLDSINHLLMTQDKRNIKCYIQGRKHDICPYEPLRPIVAGKRKPCARFLSGLSASLLPSPPTAMFVTVDLMSLHNFVSLENAIRYHVRFAVLDREASSWEKIFGTPPPQNLEEVFFKSSFEIWFCALDGSRHKIDTKERDWLTFCSSVCHLTVVLKNEDTKVEPMDSKESL